MLSMWCVSLADHLRHLPTGQVTEIIEMFCSHLQDDLPSETSNDDTTSSGELYSSDLKMLTIVYLIGLPRKKRRKLQNKELMLYQTIDLFCIVLDHIPLVGIDIAKLMHRQLYHDIVLPLLTSLPSSVNMIGCCLDNL